MAELVDAPGLGPGKLCLWGFKSLYPHLQNDLLRIEFIQNSDKMILLKLYSI